MPSASPSLGPSASASDVPSAVPSGVPSGSPSELPSSLLSAIPSASPSTVPSALPSTVPSLRPSLEPSVSASDIPSAVPSRWPSVSPTPYDRVGPGERNSCSSNFNAGNGGCRKGICLGDCKYHNDCREDSVCVKDPTGPVGPCTGEPQSAEVYAANPETGRHEWTKGPLHLVDYCIPACEALLDDQQDKRDSNKDLTQEYYEEICSPIGLSIQFGL
eukprot:CAMPEP_0172394584 /NCGR_PEP_ID=MMETSP1061-20121228/15623_1 /TAXON_ID=37318 /ORGANISM="Pseudo-nitzschia pungens, Strain cf. pungens" /LENGTH=216 /DNA_ID=CAMNT_0013125983 /DNA_START=116 /DNA_END=766 /DNA_ORIENTATION=-